MLLKYMYISIILIVTNFNRNFMLLYNFKNDCLDLGLNYFMIPKPDFYVKWMDKVEKEQVDLYS